MTQCNAHPPADPEQDQQKINARMAQIKHKICVLSGKGGVGKSTVAVNLATALADAGKKVGLLDVDIHGPSIPTMLGIGSTPLVSNAGSVDPVYAGNLKVMSVGFLTENEDDAFIWRGPMKMGVIKQFLGDVEWGELDYLIVDCPPGTGDEPLSVSQLIEDPAGAVIVTTPQQVAAVDVRKSLTFCKKLSMPILGIVENMSGFTCPNCGEVVDIFLSGGGEKMAADFGVPFLGKLPIDPSIGKACDAGMPFIQSHAASETAQILREIIKPFLTLENDAPSATQPRTEQKGSMKIAVPTANGKLSMHFGHCEKFALVEVDPETKTIAGSIELDPPPHEPGVLPRWLAEQGANLIIAGGMGQSAQSLFEEQNIGVVVGAPSEEPEILVKAYLAGALEAGTNACDH